jgi:hypothetical protein
MTGVEISVSFRCHNALSSKFYPAQKLHWTKRYAPTQHSLHSNQKTIDFIFLKVIRAHALTEGSSHFAFLYPLVPPLYVDSVVSILEILNAGTA